MELTEDHMSLTREEYALAERAKTDDAAFSLLYERYFPKIYAYIFRRLGNREQTEDVVSVTFEKVFLHLDKFKPGGGGTFQAWVYRIATNAVIDYIRKEKHTISMAPEDLPEEIHPTTGLDATHEMIKLEDSEAVQRVIKKLPQRYQEVIQLKYFSELSNIEVAEVLQISANNTGVLLSRALKQFSQLYTSSEKQ
jgi:RNA polymerase sigma-70 factor (ECF subfamily)